jgi:hypothetical protein
MKTVSYLVSFVVAVATVHASDMPIPKMGKAVCESFDTFAGTFESLPPGIAVSNTGSNCLTAADSDDFKSPHPGGTAEGACRPWDLGNGDHALGYQPTASEFTPGFFMLTISNAAAEAGGVVEVSYEIVCLNNENRSSRLDFEYSRDGVAFTAVRAAAYASPREEDSPAHWTVTKRSVGIRLRPALEPGQRFWFKWRGDDNGGSGSRDEYGINNVCVILKGRKGTVISVH